MKSGPGELPVKVLDAAVELLGRGGRGGAVRVQGQSMLPTLLPGELLAVEFGSRNLRTGDMLLFRQADYLVVHRLLGPARRRGGVRCLRTRGDGVLGLDPPVDPARIVGRAIAVKRGQHWRGFESRAARVYARSLAWHDLFWAVTGVSAYFVDRVLRRLRLPRGLVRRVGAVDRWLLQRVHGLLFDRLHPPVAPPAEAVPGRQAPNGTADILNRGPNH